MTEALLPTIVVGRRPTSGTVAVPRITGTIRGLRPVELRDVAADPGRQLRYESTFRAKQLRHRLPGAVGGSADD